jgi:methionyl-tRNA synthetase
MNITSIDQVPYKNAYGIFCHSLPKMGNNDALIPTFCQIEIGGKTTLHNHFEPELFFIVQGHGEMTIGEQTRAVKPGDLIQIPPFSSHTLKNIGESKLQFLSIYIKDYPEIYKELYTEISTVQTLPTPTLPTDAVITAAPPTPNGPLHLGHISGPYLAADILSRYLRSKSVTVITHTGTDDHQNYVGEKARSLQLETAEFRSHRRARIQRGFCSMDIHFDEFIEPSRNNDYQHKIKNFFKRAVDANIIQLQTIEIPHCDHCDLTLVDVHADGTCPHCASPSRGGCETCGMVVPSYELNNVHCNRCGQTARSFTRSAYTFDLKHYLPLIADNLAQLSLSPRLQQLVDSVQAQPTVKVLVAYPTENDLGIQVDGRNLHVWFEMAAHYETFASSDKFWIHSFGFDNSFYYLLFIPALLKALNSKTKLPDAVITNEFLLLDSAKFSTSRGHAIWADEFAGNSEHLRFFLSTIRPSQQTSNFDLNAFNIFSAELKMSLAKILDQATHIVSAKIVETEADPTVIIQTQRFLKDFEMNLVPQNFDSRRASRLVLNFIDITTQALGNLQNDKLRIQTLGTALIPFMPKTSKRILSILSVSTCHTTHAETL